ncbi:MAG TPA: N-acetyl-gamma-glutamyl-phosphate reductase [Candidatus Nanopelagicaceae bacterium]
MKVAVLGASGYAGGELLRLLAQHPTFHAEVITANSHAGERISHLHPQLTGYGDQVFISTDIGAIASCDLAFLAMPHGESSKVVAQLPAGMPIVDLGADFRLESSVSWEKYYGGEHPGTWVYGLPELPGLRDAIRKSHRVANPGCYATAIALAASPVLSVVNSKDIVVVAASGTTGAGRSEKRSLLGSEVMGSLTSYKFGGMHQHTPEIEESLRRTAHSEVNISFTPILAPMPRGILATVTASLTSEVSESDLRQLFENQYGTEAFISLLPAGQMPKTSSVIGSNRIALQVALDEHTNRVVISAAIDNLGKGAAGQAVQNANIISGLPEDSGLRADGLGV